MNIPSIPRLLFTDHVKIYSSNCNTEMAAKSQKCGEWAERNPRYRQPWGYGIAMSVDRVLTLLLLIKHNKTHWDLQQLSIWTTVGIYMLSLRLHRLLLSPTRVVPIRTSWWIPSAVKFPWYQLFDGSKSEHLVCFRGKPLFLACRLSVWHIIRAKCHTMSTRHLRLQLFKLLTCEQSIGQPRHSRTVPGGQTDMQPQRLSFPLHFLFIHATESFVQIN